MASGDILSHTDFPPVLLAALIRRFFTIQNSSNVLIMFKATSTKEISVLAAVLGNRHVLVFLSVEALPVSTWLMGLG